jgi:hypothetical protein
MSHSATSVELHNSSSHQVNSDAVGPRDASMPPRKLSMSATNIGFAVHK